MNTQTAPSSPLQIAILLLAVATAVIHLILGVQVTDLLFILNGLGYLGLVGALYLPVAFLSPYQGLVRCGLIAYTALTIILWAIINGQLEPVGLVTKAIEVLLIVALFVEMRRTGIALRKTDKSHEVAKKTIRRLRRWTHRLKKKGTYPCNL